MSKKPDSSGTITIRAPAKINLGLRVLSKRPDGYHEVLTLMVPVSLCDVVRLKLSSTGIELRCSDRSLPTGKENLVYRAARLILDECRSEAGVNLELSKTIPVGAGLGGGSSDAAATLLAMNELLGHPLQDYELHRLGTQLGADVPFFLLGRAAMAEGIGDRLTPLDTVPTIWTLVVYPNFQVSTRWAYENLTLTTMPNESKFYVSGEKCAGKVAACRQRLLQRQQLSLEELLPVLDNDFETLIFRHHPQLHEIRRAVLAAGAEAVPMTGSGPTLVGLFASEEETRAASGRLSRREGLVTFVARTIDGRDECPGQMGG
jgi:4-diphosphocytidyl-2-C-methyl-D-erythritol kinase